MNYKELNDNELVYLCAENNEEATNILISKYKNCILTTLKEYLKEYKRSIKFEIWDTAGQEKYRALAKVFYKNAAVCILVYDITRRKSFDELKEYWINEIKSNGSPNLSKLFSFKNLINIFIF